MRHFLFAAAAAASLSLAGAASADNPCGNFNFSSGLDCKILVSGGCSAQCQPINFEVGCTGHCNASATTTCSGNCGAQCVAQCDPAKLDCFEGCHAECDSPVTAQCKAKGGTGDCVAEAQAQCDVHCKDVCKVQTNSSCQEHCTMCCAGSCTTQANFDCDYSCFADLKGGCDVQCSAPSGALFCNGQYVHASDIQACVDYLVSQGINVDVSASGTIKCNLSGCNAAGGVSVGGLPKVGGCSASAADPLGTGLGLGGFGAAFAAMIAGAVRRRRRAVTG